MAILFDLLTLIQSSIANRGLPGVTSANVLLQKRPATTANDLPDAPFPCILIAPWGKEDLDPHAGTNLRDDIVYPIVVAVVANDSHNQTLNFEQYLTWRESIRKLFNQQPLPNQVTVKVNATTYPSGTLSFHVVVEPLDIVDRDRWDKVGKFISGMVLKCASRETRG